LGSEIKHLRISNEGVNMPRTIDEKDVVVKRTESVIEVLENTTKNLKTLVKDGKLTKAYLEDPEELAYTLKNLELRISGIVDEIDYYASIIS
jgi:hypothetical protein